MPIPKSLSKKKKALLTGQPCTSHKLGDLDNLAKNCMDAANGVLYKDDSQVYELHTYKVYSGRPRTEITILEYTDEC